MTQSGYSPSPPINGASGAESAKHVAAEAGTSAAERVGDVAGVVGEQTKQTASEVGAQAKNLLDEGMQQLRGQAKDGQQKLAESVRDMVNQLRKMSDRTEDSGTAATLVRQATDRADQVASWLESREPGDLVEEMRRFARQRPGVFLAGAVAAGAVAGRLTRNVVASAKNDGGTPGHGTAAPAADQVARPAQPAVPMGRTVDPLAWSSELPPTSGDLPPMGAGGQQHTMPNPTPRPIGSLGTEPGPVR